MGVLVKNKIKYTGGWYKAPVIYSEDEREVGVWVDGKPLYQKTIVYDTPFNIANDTWYTSTESYSDIKLITNAWVINSAGAIYNGIIVVIENSKLVIGNQTKNQPINNLKYVILQYTKTTDEPGSGIYVPSGEKAHHYSTNEQIIGTWIDGNTLYEKTIVAPNFSTTISEWGWYGGQIDISSIILNISQSFPILEKSYITLGDTTTRQPCYIDCQVPSSPVVYFPGSSRSGTLTLTIQYTKTSS